MRLVPEPYRHNLLAPLPKISRKPHLNVNWKSDVSIHSNIPSYWASKFLIDLPSFFTYYCPLALSIFLILQSANTRPGNLFEVSKVCVLLSQDQKSIEQNTCLHKTRSRLQPFGPFKKPGAPYYGLKMLEAPLLIQFPNLVDLRLLVQKMR